MCLPFPATTFPYLKSIPHTNVRLMFPKYHFHQEIVLLKYKHHTPYILTMYKIKLKHLDLIFKTLHNLIPIFGPILSSTNHMQKGSFTQNTLYIPSFPTFLIPKNTSIFLLFSMWISPVVGCQAQVSSINSSLPSNQWLPFLIFMTLSSIHWFL